MVWQKLCLALRYKDKIFEEINEVLGASNSNLEMECGDLLFAVVNLLRFLGVDGEVALNKACAKFAGRVVISENPNRISYFTI